MTAAQVAQVQTSVVVDGLTKSFAGRRVLDSVDFTVDQGEFVALLGRSGGGKSTILKILAGLESADDGTVLTRPNRTIVFQEPRLVNGGCGTTSPSGCRVVGRSGVRWPPTCSLRSVSTGSVTPGRPPFPVVRRSVWPWPGH